MNGRSHAPTSAAGRPLADVTGTVLAIIAALAVAGLVAWAGGHGGTRVLRMPLFALCGAIAFVVNWMAFVPAYLRRTERYYDLTGSATHIALLGCALVFGPEPDARSLVLAGLGGIWAVRLGAFLHARIQRAGSDPRFDVIKRDASRFFLAWTLQGLWVFLTLAAALAAITSRSRVPLGWPAVVGILVWCVGFSIEAVADWQKRTFRSHPGNRGKFITSGLWASCRHPNYFGEIVLWTGIALIAAPALTGWQLATLVSPVFVYLLLTRVSGVPILEARAEKQWGRDPGYRAYRTRTPMLVPRIPARSS